ncbi:hypothetical protein [Helicobacter sp. 13S00477-4]|uniref:hypothetical protein n=1 Tax=Helicobacter sp. 13S00477-4 TaxID=1905759 RepID=UPI000BA7D3F5|nr:hypothetical protein [Helicobacter sp. 13S00477-4]PAF50859.1 hypothetical protein BKH44_06840 [Helicobacter sp. 13S00477-4]
MQLDLGDYLLISAIIPSNDSYSKSLETKAHNAIAELKIATIKFQIAMNDILQKENEILAKNINDYNQFFDETYTELRPKFQEKIQSLDNGLQKELQEIKTSIESKKSVDINELVETRKKQNEIVKEYLKNKIKIANDIELDKKISLINKKFESKKITSFIKKIKAKFFQRAIYVQQINQYTNIVLPTNNDEPKKSITRRLCIYTLNFFKIITFYYPCIFITIIFILAGNNDYEKIMETSAYGLLFFIPVYWVLLLIQKIMTDIFDNANKDEYVNCYRFWEQMM